MLCPAEGLATYPMFTSVEPDLTTARLTTAGTAGVWREATPAGDPVGEFFVEGPDGGLERMVLLSADGVPDQLAPPLLFAGQTFGFARSLPQDEAPPNRKRVGCAGPFRMGAVAGEDRPPFRRLFADVGDRILVFSATVRTDNREPRRRGASGSGSRTERGRRCRGRASRHTPTRAAGREGSSGVRPATGTTAS